MGWSPSMTDKYEWRVSFPGCRRNRGTNCHPERASFAKRGIWARKLTRYAGMTDELAGAT